MITRENIIGKVNINIISAYYRTFHIIKDDDQFNVRMGNWINQMFWGERVTKSSLPYILYVTQDDGIKGFTVRLEEVIGNDFSDFYKGNLKRVRIIAKIGEYHKAYADIRINIANTNDSDDPMSIIFYPCLLTASGEPILPIVEDSRLNFLRAVKVVMTDTSADSWNKLTILEKLTLLQTDSDDYLDEGVVEFFLGQMQSLFLVKQLPNDATEPASYKAIVTADMFEEIFGISLSGIN
jgi:hypothetical protein